MATSVEGPNKKKQKTQQLKRQKIGEGDVVFLPFRLLGLHFWPNQELDLVNV
jgi:hypothetical protein